MKIKIFKEHSITENCDEYRLSLKNKVIPITFSLRKVIKVLLSFDDKLIVKNCYFPFKDNCIGIKESSKHQSLYEVIYSDFEDVKVGDGIVMCSDQFQKAVGWFRYTFYHSYYFQLVKDE